MRGKKDRKTYPSQSGFFASVEIDFESKEKRRTVSM
jgi:hypothetical protein